MANKTAKPIKSNQILFTFKYNAEANKRRNGILKFSSK